MKPLNPSKIADSYVQGMNSAGPAYKEGIDAVTENPAAKAAAALPKALRKYTEAINSGRTAAALGRVTLENWKTQAKNKGANRLGSGATEAKSKLVAYWQAVGPAVSQLQASIAAMPNDTEADAEARQLAWSRGMRAIKAQR